MAFNKGFEKKSVQTQDLTLSALHRIEKYSERQAETTDKIYLEISKNIISGSVQIVSELKRQTILLTSIAKKIGSSSSVRKDNNPIDKLLNKIKDTSVKDNLVAMAKIIAITGVAFYALGKGLGLMKDIKPEMALAASLSVYFIFADFREYLTKN